MENAQSKTTSGKKRALKYLALQSWKKDILLQSTLTNKLQGKAKDAAEFPWVSSGDKRRIEPQHLSYVSAHVYQEKPESLEPRFKWKLKAEGVGFLVEFPVRVLLFREVWGMESIEKHSSIASWIKLSKLLLFQKLYNALQFF